MHKNYAKNEPFLVIVHAMVSTKAQAGSLFRRSDFDKFDENMALGMVEKK